MCDIDELEFAEYLRYVEAGAAAAVPGSQTKVIGRRHARARVHIALTIPEPVAA